MTLDASSLADVQQVVRAHPRLAVVGASTKTDGRRVAVPVLSTRSLSGILEYTPDECVVTLLPGTPIAEVDAHLDRHGQYLPFDPPFAADGATIGGTVAAGVSGPRRYRYGGVRDFLIGARVVDGEGRAVRSGGKVVKNAAGFLLHHALVGSGGLFGVITELSFKVFPRPEARRGLTVPCGDVATACSAARAVARLGADCEAIDFDHRGTLSITIAGRRAAIDSRLAHLSARLSATLDARMTVEAAEAAASTIRDSHPASNALSCVKVAGAVPHWPVLQPHVTAAHFMCAGSVAWLWTRELDALSASLAGAGRAGLVIRGPHAGTPVGRVAVNAFHERVRRVLDPQDRFRAASHSDR